MAIVYVNNVFDANETDKAIELYFSRSFVYNNDKLYKYFFLRNNFSDDL